MEYCEVQGMFEDCYASLFLLLGMMGCVEQDGFESERALGDEGHRVTALCHAARGRALGAANAGIATAVL